MKDKIVKDIICQVLANDKSKEIIDKVLDEFLPGYDKLNLDYTCPPDNPDYRFKSEDEMVNYFIDTPDSNQTFYWSKQNDNQDKLMVGADITSDDKLIISLTLDGTLETGSKYFQRLKGLLNSNTGVITYVNPAEYNTGQEFIVKYCK